MLLEEAKRSAANHSWKKKRLPGAGRKAKLPDMEEQLAFWIIELRSRNCCITRAAIQRKDLELYKGHEDFIASREWLSNFFKHHEFSSRRRTTVGQKLPQDHIQKISSYLMRLRKMRYINNYPLSSIGNMEETPLWLHMPGDTTVVRVGERSIPIHTTGHDDKGCFTVILTALADGRKLKPFVVFKGVCLIQELTWFPGAVVCMHRNGWMSEDLTIQYLDKVWGQLSFTCRLLIWDAYRCHMMDKVRMHVDKQTNSDMCILPGGTTNHLQPADVSWNKPFKGVYRVLYNQWMASGEQSFTLGGNMRAPDKLTCLKWVVESWEVVTSEVIVKSFKVCGISVAVDGSEDGDIHCLKSGEVAADAAEEIHQLTTEMLASQRC